MSLFAHSIDYYLGPRTDLDALEKRKLSLSHQEYKPNSYVVQLVAFNCPG